MSEHQPDEIQLLDPRCVLMDDEIGHVCIRLFKRGEIFTVGSMAYMGRKLTDSEARRLTRLWNEIAAFLRSKAPHKQTQEEDDE